MSVSVGVPVGGKHLILELWSDNADILKDANKLRDICSFAARKANAIIISNDFHHFGGDFGVSGVVILAESHITIHTWPEEKYCAIDVFMCGNCDPINTLEYFKTALHATKCEMMTIQRPIKGNENA